MAKKSDKRKSLQTRRIGAPGSSAKSDLSQYETQDTFMGGPKLAFDNGMPVQKLAFGGSLGDMSFLEIAASGVRPYYTPDEQKWLDERKAEYDAYNSAISDYNTAAKAYQGEVDAYNTKYINPYQKAADEYNAAVAAYNKDFYDPYVLAVEAYNKAVEKYNADPNATTPPTLPTAPKEFSLAVPTPPPAFTGVAPTQPTAPKYSETEVQNYATTAQNRAKQSAANRSSALRIAADPEAYNLSGLSVNLPFKKGGEVSTTEFIRKRTDGSPEWGEIAGQMTIGTPMTEQEQSQPSMARQAFDAVVGAGKQVGANLKEAVTDPVAFNKRALGNLVKQLQNNPEEFIMNWTGGGLGGVLKPKGGAFPKAGTGSGIDDYLGRVEESVGREAGDLTIGQIKTLNDFIREKGRKYLTTTYGSGSDPLREALLEGRLPNLGTDKTNFREYMLRSAREGNPEALEDFERLYDTKSGIGQFVVTPGPSQYELASQIRDKARQDMLAKIAKEGVEESRITEPFIQRKDVESMLKDYSPEYQKNLARTLLNQELNLSRPVDVTDETLIRAARQGEVFYDLPSAPSLDFLNPTNLARSLSTLNPDKLGNMSFTEAVIQGTKNTRLQRDWDEVVKKVEGNKSVPKEMFDIGTETFKPMGEDKWVRLTTPQAVQLEGAAMHHSVGGYAKKGNYGEGGREALESGRAQVFSLRGPDNLPRVTIEARRNEDGSLWVKQIKGNFNGVPDPKDQEVIVEFLKSLPIDKIQPESYARSVTGEELAERVRIDWSDKAGFGARSIF